MSQQTKIGFVAVLIVVGVMGLGGVVVGGVMLASGAISSKPNAAKEGEVWNARELADYLKSRGVIDKEAKEMAIPFSSRPTLGFFTNDKFQIGICHYDSPKMAREWSGLSKEYPSFAWGSFCVIGLNEPVAKAKSALIR